jgi:hypothetical protein
MAVWGRNLAADLFPVRLKWRMWLSYFGPMPIAVAWPYVVEPTLINWLVVLAFYLFVIRSFTRLMIRSQIKADARLQIRLFEQAEVEISALLEFVTPEERRQYADLAEDLARRAKILKQILADFEK